MAPSGDPANDLRILVLTPRGRDSALAEQTLARAGLSAHVCDDLDALRRECGRGAGCILVAEEALPRAFAEDASSLENGPSWSSLPVVILLGRRVSSPNVRFLRALETRPNVTFLERPVPKRTLISAVRAALEARQLQYTVRDALEELEDANRKKDEFLAILSHELRNPLAPIRSAVYVLQRSDPDAPGAGEKARDLLGMMERQVDHLVRLVDDLLEVSRISTGKIVLRKRRENLVDILRQAQELAEPLISAQRHVLTVDVGDDPLMVDCDPVRFVQILANLLNNAAKYTPSGGHLRLSARAEGGEAVVAVRDDGIGISTDMLPKVFDLFSQSRRAEGREQGGLGIGLALARKLVELHGGRIEARSAGPDLGAEFLVWLPLAARDERTARSAASTDDGVSKQKALVVDDVPDVAESFALLLESVGVETRVANSGLEALEAVTGFAPDVVFLDLGMPGMDGYETAKRLRATPVGRDIPLVALSGWGRSEDRERTKQAGFSHHFVKPMPLDALRSILAPELVGG